MPTFSYEKAGSTFTKIINSESAQYNTITYNTVANAMKSSNVEPPTMSKMGVNIVFPQGLATNEAMNRNRKPMDATANHSGFLLLLPSS